MEIRLWFKIVYNDKRKHWAEICPNFNKNVESARLTKWERGKSRNEWDQPSLDPLLGGKR